MILSEGVFEDLEPKIYYDIGIDQAISFSSIAAFSREPTPRHYWEKRVNPLAPKEAFSMPLYLGSLFHELVEKGREKFLETRHITPRGVAKGSFEHMKLCAENGDKKAVRAQDIEPLLKMYDKLSETEIFKTLTAHGKHEVSMFIEYGGHWIKGRCDLMIPEHGIIVDWKTTPVANPLSANDFWESIDTWSYTAQAALYCEMAEKIYKKPFRFLIGACEKEFPHEACFIEIRKPERDEAMEKFRPHMDNLIKCIKSNDWPGYGERIYTREDIGKNSRDEKDILRILKGV